MLCNVSEFQEPMTGVGEIIDYLSDHKMFNFQTILNRFRKRNVNPTEVPLDETVKIPMENKYLVARPIYSEDSFSAENELVQRHHTTILDQLKRTCRCSAQKAKRITFNFFPILSWLPQYTLKEWILNDIISGVTTGLVAVLQGLAYALLTNVPPGYGLYAAFFPVVVYFFFGTSRHLSAGPFPVTCLMVGSVVSNLVSVTSTSTGNSTTANSTDETLINEQKVTVAASLTFLVGIVQLIMGFLQFGFIVIYLSEPLINGFTTAAAIQVVISQLKYVFGLTVPTFNGPLANFLELQAIFFNLRNTNIASLVISIIVMVVLYISKEVNDYFKAKMPVPIPIEIILTIIGAGVSYAFDLQNRFGVPIVGTIQRGFQHPVAPSLAVFQASISNSISTAIVGFAVAFSVAQVYAVKHNYTIDGNQELIAFGLCNIVCGAFKGFVASTSLARSSVQESSGGKTQIAGILSGGIVLIVTLALGFLLEPLPKAVLASIIIINLKRMLMKFNELPLLFRRDRYDLVVWVVTFLGSVILGLDLGLAVGVGIELLTVIFRIQFPKYAMLANIGRTDIYKNRKDYSDIYEPDGIKIFRCPAPIIFANIDAFKEKLLTSVGFNPLWLLRKRNKALQKITKLAKKGALHMTPKGLVSTSFDYEVSDDEELSNNRLEELDQRPNTDDLPIVVDWNEDLPNNIQVPKIDLHSLILDFGAVSFIDMSGMKALKAILKEFYKVEVDTYIAGADCSVLDKLKRSEFFDKDIKTSIFFLTVHDAVLHVLEKKGLEYAFKSDSEKDAGSGLSLHGMTNGTIYINDHVVDKFMSDVSDLKSELGSMSRWISVTENRIGVNFKEIEDLKEQVASLSSSRQHMLKIDDLEKRLKHFTDLLGILKELSSLEIERAHRLGPPRDSNQSGPHPVIFKCLNFQHKELIWAAARNTGPLHWDGQRLFLFLDYSAEVSRARREMSSICSQLVKNGTRFSLLYPVRLCIFTPQGPKDFTSVDSAKDFVSETTESSRSVSASVSMDHND
ncbi:chloride anion exchanger-like [Pseudophryne corroboree]|uniref:chloride anion exchanger-like n=1 Tax=Pseudophryne corroboree TaxID=495146 RepID=UPI0030820B7D